MDATLDLGKSTPVQSVRINAYQYNNAWIFLPKKVTVETSADGKKWETMGTAYPQAKPEQRGQFIEAFHVNSAQPISARYIRLRAENLLTVPDWHEAAGSDAWLFMDEIILR